MTWKSIKDRAYGLGYEFTEIENVQWKRGSRRQDRSIPMSGVVGRLTISGDVGNEISTLLALGETCHIGADVALGCGRYRIVA